MYKQIINASIMLIHSGQYSTVLLIIMLYTVAVGGFIAVVGSLEALDDPTDKSNFCASCYDDQAVINRRGFPRGFIFGAGSAAYQIEGGYNVSGKGPSLWDNFTHTYPEKIKDGSNGDVAVDSYHLYKEDVRILKDMGMDAYKFSISWPRILPGGSLSKGVNPDGIKYYNNLIDELLANDIQPWVVLLHFDIPQALQDEYGGCLSPKIVEDFRDFAEVMFREFGDRVKYWITINEPWAISYLGFTLGMFPPERCSIWLAGHCSRGDSATEPYIVTHNQLLAHGAVVKLYRDRYQKEQKGNIGICVNSNWFVPQNKTRENVEAKYRLLDFMLGWVMHPISFGTYPKSMRERVGTRLPEFTTQESDMLRGSMDFVGVNYYGAYYAVHVEPPSHVSYITDGGAIYIGKLDGLPITKPTSPIDDYYIYPKGLRKLLLYIKEKYNDPLIYITENGLGMHRNDSKPMSEALKDYRRKKYFLDHLCCLREAIEQDGVNVGGFFVWSLLDNFEWNAGFLDPYGLYYVDLKDNTLPRYPKLSAQWFKSILTRRVETSQPLSVSDE